MKSPVPFSIDMLTTYKENSRLEVKKARGGLPNSLWESYSAFANSDGGVIVLGVDEKVHGKLIVEGLDDAHKMLKDFWNMVNNRQKISSNILTDNMAYVDNLDGKDVIVIHVPRAERTSRPVYVGTDPRTGTYRRNFEGDYHCSLDEVSLMIRDSALATDDAKLLIELDVNVFCPDTVKAYRNIFRNLHQNHLWNSEDDAIFLRRIGAVRENKDTGKFHPTAAGLLMFGYEYEITAIFPNYFLDYQENRTNGIHARWTDRITSQSGDWSGNVFDFILKVIPKLQSDLKMPFMFNGNYRDEDTPLHKTLREATVNMLANADFYGRRGIVVQKGANGFKFANPGNMRVALVEALHDNASDPRNGVMMKMLAMVDYGERAGSGLQGIFTTWKSVYHCTPKLEVTTSGGVDRTILTLDFEGHTPDIEAMKSLYGNPYNNDYTNDILVVKEPSWDTPMSTNVLQNVPRKAKKIPQKTKSVPQNTPKKTPNILQKAKNVPQNAKDVLQSRNRVPQDKKNSIPNEIIKLISENPHITRELIAKEVGVSSKTVGRYLSKLGISWAGHPRTGHWVLPYVR